MKFNLFRKNKKTEQTEAPVAPSEETVQTETTATGEEPKTEMSPTQTPEPKSEPEDSASVNLNESLAAEKQPEITAATVEVSEASNKTYLKAMPLKDLADVEKVKSEILSGNIVILKLTPLALKSLDDVKVAVNELDKFSGSVGGDIGRLGEERVVICPKNVRIWRERMSVQSEALPTAATTAA